MQRSEKALGCLQTCFVPADPEQRPPQPHSPGQQGSVPRGTPNPPAAPVSFPTAAPHRLSPPEGNPRAALHSAGRSAGTKSGRAGSPPRVTYAETILPLRISAGAMARAGRQRPSAAATPKASARQVTPTAAPLRASRAPKLSAAAGPTAQALPPAPPRGREEKGHRWAAIGSPHGGGLGVAGAVTPALPLPPP